MEVRKMKTRNLLKSRGLYGASILSALLFSFFPPAAALSEVSTHTNLEFSSDPITQADTVTPMVMITASNDHQLYFKAYSDYSDLDNDGAVDTTFKPTVVYYGYFDSYKCYDYDTTDLRFEPVADSGESYLMNGNVTSYNATTGELKFQVVYIARSSAPGTAIAGFDGLGPFTTWTVNKWSGGTITWTGSSSTSNTLEDPNAVKTFTIDTGASINAGDVVTLETTVPGYCDGANSGYWSGNFLNWVSMSRIDAVRKILFGGHRRVDTATETVLERTYLPHDAHSWAKHYDGKDLCLLTPFVYGTDYSLNNADARIDGMTFANTTDSSITGAKDFSDEVTDPPLIKVVTGNYSLWAGNERWQCTWDSGSPKDNHGATNANSSADSGIYSYSSSPDYTQGKGEKNYVARVQACVDGLLGQENCKLYPGPDGSPGTADDIYKPIGLFQVYGDEDRLLFGMMAGTYQKHASGGELISDITSISDEVNVDTDGTFKLVAITAGGPTANNKSYGMINAWCLYRPVGYSQGDGTYNGVQGDSCPWGLSDESDTTDDGKCMNWGNPFSEIYLQSVRYLAGKGVAGIYRANDSVKIPGLNTPLTWKDQLDETNYCARLNIVNFNSSVMSYDEDDLDGVSYGVITVWDNDDLPGAKTAAAMTDVVGAGENIHGNQYFVGETDIDVQGDGDDQLCTAKTINSLGNAGGLCPEAPRMQGSFRLAGISYYAHVKDIRPDLDDTQKIDTYCVALASAAPKVEIPYPDTPGSTAVTIMPACRNTDLNPEGNCAIVDFKIVNQDFTVGATHKGTGKIYINWEDSEQGGDFDQDMWGILEYEIDDTADTITITTNVIAESTGYAMGFGYVINGTTQDGFHAHSGIEGYTYDDPATITAGSDCASGCNTGDTASTATYSLGSSTASSLEDPMWYAAKWGGFIDGNGNDIPDVQSEWDSKDANGAMNPDGIPDNYFYAENPSQLEDSLNRVFLNILQRVSSGTSAAVVSNKVSGEGALYQAYYEPMRQDTLGNSVNWIGSVHALWLDDYGYMREDDGDGKLEDYDTDMVVESFYDTTENRTRIRRWTSSDPDKFTPSGSTTIELKELSPLWNAREQLCLPSAADSDIISQRDYSTDVSLADERRFIKTWIDADLDGIVDAGEYLDFVDTTITSGNYGLFDLATEAEAEQLVNYLRGKEIAGYRNRTMDYDGDNTTETLRLGDIINSTPTIVTRPMEAFDLLYRDTTYGPFKARYENRRHVLYTGANDGMLHAINAGFFDVQDKQFRREGYKPGTTATNPASYDAVAHPLGSELWAYVPYNLLPHLKWLKEIDYLHVYYVDGKPKVFDAKIFTDDTDHPEGWGTVLVVGMRLGGGPMTIDTAADGLGGLNAADDRTLSSAFIIFDITNPEEEPELLAEVRVPDHSFSTVYPCVMTFKDIVAADDDNKWYLVFGSGPEIIETASSTTNAKLYILDLDEITNPGTIASTAHPTGCSVDYTNTMGIITCDTGVTQSFLGTPITVDWNLSYKADTVYFGVVGDADADTGALWRFSVNGDEYDHPTPDLWDTPAAFVDTSLPVSAAVTASVDEYGHAWVFFGTGRLYADADKSSANNQRMFGMKDNYEFGVAGFQPPPALTIATLADVTDIEVYTDGSITGCYSHTPAITTFQDLENDIDLDMNGWYLTLPPIVGAAGTDPATRSLSQPALLGGVLFNSVYQPNMDLCSSEGYSRLYGLYYKTGTAYHNPNVFGYEEVIVGTEEMKRSRKYLDLGRGYSSSPTIHTGSGSGSREVSVFTQLSTGTVIRNKAETVDAVRSGMQSWRQVE